jgi:hypothetical protein
MTNSRMLRLSAAARSRQLSATALGSPCRTRAWVMVAFAGSISRNGPSGLSPDRSRCQTCSRIAIAGINAVQLMELGEPPDPRLEELVPVATHSVKRRIVSTQPDYWDYATLLELAVLEGNEEKVMHLLPDTWPPSVRAGSPRVRCKPLRRLHSPENSADPFQRG